MTAIAAWASTNAAVANVGAQGLATGGSPGSATISATHSGIAGTSTLTVRAAARLTKFAYVVNGQSHSVSAYTVDAEIGNLTPVPGISFWHRNLAGVCHRGPVWQVRYVANFSDRVSLATLCRPTAPLSQSSAPRFRLVFCRSSLPWRPRAGFAYVVNRGSGTVSVHLVDTVTGASTRSQAPPWQPATLRSTRPFTRPGTSSTSRTHCQAISRRMPSRSGDRILGPVPGSPLRRAHSPFSQCGSEWAVPLCRERGFKCSRLHDRRRSRGLSRRWWLSLRRGIDPRGHPDRPDRSIRLRGELRVGQFQCLRDRRQHRRPYASERLAVFSRPMAPRRLHSQALVRTRLWPTTSRTAFPFTP